MALSDGMAATLSAVVVAGLAVGLGYGAHAILPAPEGDANPSANPTSPQGPQADGFCELMEDMVLEMEQMNEAMMASLFLGIGEDLSEAEALDAIRSFGQTLVEATGAIDDYLVRAAELVTDPDSASAFLQLAQAMEGLGQTWGAAALEAESLQSYELAMEALATDPEFAAAMAEGDTAEPIVTQYVFDTCGIDLNGETATGLDTALKADVSTLGKEVATYYVEWSPGDPQPVITASDGEYYLGDTFIGFMTEGAVLTDQYALGPADWCVELSAEDDLEMVFSYSAMQGLQSDTCASLQS